MKNIAIINCVKASEVCAGVSCMDAFYEKKAAFGVYGGEDLRLIAFMLCNGCDCDVETDPGLQRKIDRLVKSNTEVAHFGVCTKDQQTGEECVKITELAGRLEGLGMQIVRGTH